MARRGRGSTAIVKPLDDSGGAYARANKKLGLPHSGCRQISELTKCIKGGKERFMEFARLAVNIEPALACVVDAYHNFTMPLQKYVSLDDLCAFHKVDPIHFLSVVAEAAAKYGNNSSILIAALHLPEVVKKSVDMAMTDEGISDRKMLFQHSNFIPSPGGVVVNNNNTANAAASAQGDARKTLQSFETTMREIDEVVRDRE